MSSGSSGFGRYAQADEEIRESLDYGNDADGAIEAPENDIEESQ